MTTVLDLVLTMLATAFSAVAALGVLHGLRESARVQFDAAFEKHARTGLSHAEIDRLCTHGHWGLGRTWLASQFFAAACMYRGLADERHVRDAEARKWATGEDPLDQHIGVATCR